MTGIIAYNSVKTSVSGRSGRSDKKGEVVIQSFNSEHYAITHAKNNNYIGFYNEEMKIRQTNKYPPYFYMLSILVKSKEYNLVSAESNRITTILSNNLCESIILGPTVAHPFKVNNQCRFQIIIKYKKEPNLYNVLNIINEHYRNNNHITIDFDFNPNF